MSLIRLTSLVMCVGLSFLISPVNFYIALTALGIAHYSLAVYYSRKSLKPYAASHFVMVILGLGLSFCLSIESLALLAGLHHICSELYLDRFMVRDRMPQPRPLFLFLNAVILMLIWILVLHQRWYFVLMPKQVGMTMLAVCICVLLAYYAIYQRELGKTLTYAVVSTLFINLLFLLISQYSMVHLRQLIMYHFICWFFVPIIRNGEGERISSYLLLNVAITFPIFILGALVSGGVSDFMASYLWKLFVVASFLHYFAALSMSNLNPKWLHNIILGIKLRN